MISQAISIPMAASKRAGSGQPGASQRSSQNRIMPWIRWEKLYQSVSCCEVSGLSGSPTQSRMRPLAEIKGWPKPCSTAICRASSAAAAR